MQDLAPKSVWHEDCALMEQDFCTSMADVEVWGPKPEAATSLASSSVFLYSDACVVVKPEG